MSTINGKPTAVAELDRDAPVEQGDSAIDAEATEQQTAVETDVVEIASADSFPASDAPSWTCVTGTGN